MKFLENVIIKGIIYWGHKILGSLTEAYLYNEHVASRKDDVGAGQSNISLEAVRFWYQAILSRYNSLNTSNSSIDTKTGVLLAVAVTVLIYVEQSTSNVYLLPVVGAIGLVAVIILCLISIHARSVSTEVHTTKEREDYYSKDDETFYWQLIADLEDSLANIEPINKIKGKLYSIATYILLGAVAVIILAQFLPITITFGWK